MISITTQQIVLTVILSLLGLILLLFTLAIVLRVKVTLKIEEELSLFITVLGIRFKILPKKKISVYGSLLIAMIIGRIIWGCAMFICMGVSGGSFTLAAFVAGAFTNAIPGIIVQIVLIPILVMVLENPRISKLKKN